MAGCFRFGGGAGVLLSCSLAMAQPPGGPPGGFPGSPDTFPRPGQILPWFLQDQLNLTAEQKKKVDELQKDVDAKLGKILTAEQMKSLQEKRDPFGGPGGFGPPGGPGGFGFPGGPGGFGSGSGPARVDDAKKQIGATDEEWKVIGPKLQKVLAARQILAADVQGGPAAAGKGPTPGGGFGSPGTNRISQAQAEFKAVLEDPKHSKAELQDKVAAVRKARQRVREELDAAQKDLLQLLTADQEAILVGLGYLE